MRHRVFIENNTKMDISSYIDMIKLCALETLLHEEIGFFAEVSCIITDNDEIQGLNLQYRQKNSSTDVLSFPQYSLEELGDIPDGSEVLLGDIVLNIFRAEEQAVEYGHNLEREIGFLVVHSMLHLLGYDHLSLEGEREMSLKQESILAKIGLKR